MKEPPALTASGKGMRGRRECIREPGKHLAEQWRGGTGRGKAWALGSPLLPIRSDCDPVAPLPGLPFLTAN